MNDHMSAALTSSSLCSPPLMLYFLLFLPPPLLLPHRGAGVVGEGHQSLLLAREEGAVNAIFVEGIIHLADGKREEGRREGGRGGRKGREGGREKSIEVRKWKIGSCCCCLSFK